MAPPKLRPKFISVGFIVIFAYLLHHACNNTAIFAKVKLWWNESPQGVHQITTKQGLKTVPSFAQTGLHTDDVTGLETGVYEDEELDIEDPDWELDNFEISWSRLEDFQILTKLGMPLRSFICTTKTTD